MKKKKKDITIIIYGKDGLKAKVHLPVQMLTSFLNHPDIRSIIKEVAHESESGNDISDESMEIHEPPAMIHPGTDELCRVKNLIDKIKRELDELETMVHIRRENYDEPPF